ncbi:MAG: ABC transporter ATP-binding protein [Bacillota bacterium]|nr:ABC transporter ATP-binding protein [Bacillota bacterium]
MTGTDLVVLQGIRKDYPQGKLTVPALRGIDLTVKSGEFTAIAGPSGSGKTTMLNLIGCLDRPTAGRILLDGQELTSLSKNQLAAVRRQSIGFIFQTFNLIPVLTALENVELALTLLREVPAAEVRDRAMKVLAEVGLAGLEGRRPGELSGGQQQRVAIARALVKEPKVVLADEPTANLDSENGEAVLHLMLEMNQTKGTTFIFSTHDPRVMRHARRLVTMRDGQIVGDERRNGQTAEEERYHAAEGGGADA